MYVCGQASPLLAMLATAIVGVVNGGVRIGALLPLTGNDCVAGVHGLLAADVAVGLLSQGVGGYAGPPVELIVNDTIGLASAGLNAMDWMIHSGGVDGITTCTEAETARLVAQFAAYSSVPMALSRYIPTSLDAYGQRLALQVVQVAPRQQHFLSAAVAFLVQQRWEYATVFVYNDGNSPRILERLRQLAPPTLKLTVVLYDATQSRIRKELERVKLGTRRVALLLSTRASDKLLAAAVRLGMVGAGWVWIGSEECAWGGAPMFGGGTVVESLNSNAAPQWGVRDENNIEGEMTGLVALRSKGDTARLLSLSIEYSGELGLMGRYAALFAGCPGSFPAPGGTGLHPAAAYVADAVTALVLGLNSSTGGSGITNGTNIDAIKTVDYSGGFTGRVRFNADTGQVLEPTIEFVNLVKGQDGCSDCDMAFVPVAQWSESGGLIQVQGDALGGAAMSASSKPFGSIAWMGGGNSIPSDRTPAASHAEAGYLTLVLALVILGFALNHALYHQAHFFYLPEVCSDTLRSIFLSCTPSHQTLTFVCECSPR